MSRGEGEFDETWYLRRYPDVARAVRARAFRSGHQHYIDYGKAEGRSPCPHGNVANSPAPALKPLDWPPIEIEASASPAEMHAMADRVRRNFEFMGEREPHWSVMTSDRYLTENIANSEDEFFASGRHPVSELVATAARCGVRLDREMICFELGCGLGRSTIWLADMFARVVGCDISAPHLQLAESTARRFGKKNIGFFQMDRPESIADLPPLTCSSA
jgi:hypothetical protein